jgi:sorbitol-specific phosphotransferase system component IIA
MRRTTRSSPAISENFSVSHRAGNDSGEEQKDDRRQSDPPREPLAGGGQAADQRDRDNRVLGHVAIRIIFRGGTSAFYPHPIAVAQPCGELAAALNSRAVACGLSQIPDATNVPVIQMPSVSCAFHG